MIRKKNRDKIYIDLTGPDGNAFSLLSRVAKLGRSIGWDQKKIDSIITEMRSGDYENLVQIFDREFGDFVILER